MKTKAKIIIASIIGSAGLLTMLNLYINETGKQDVVVIDKISTNQIEGQNSNNTTTTSTITTTKKKTTKKVVKTTKKTTKKNTYIKVPTASKDTYIAYARQQSGYDDTQMNCLITLWNYESGWNPNSYNTKSDACGIPQSKPCSKIKKQQGSNDWQAQIRWGINYINGRYHGSPCEALNHFRNHNPHWY